MGISIQNFLILGNVLFAFGFYCPPNSFQMPSENVCAFAISKADYYHNAVKQCIALGGITAKIQNTFENSVLYAMIDEKLKDQAPYIGVERQLNGNWTYSDGSPLTYQHWDSNESPSATNHCAVIDPLSAKWKSVDCSTGRPFFCTLIGTPGQCPPNWVYLASTNSCYYVKTFEYVDGLHWDLFNHTVAEARCQTMGAHLVSIHSDAENDLMFDLISSNVKNLSFAAPDNYTDPCHFQYAFIGLYGLGVVQNGYWTDGTPVDYVKRIRPNLPSSPSFWIIGNDPACDRQFWTAAEDTWLFSRFICKMPASSIRSLDGHQ